jgi:hypothetical protein
MRVKVTTIRKFETHLLPVLHFASPDQDRSHLTASGFRIFQLYQPTVKTTGHTI